MKKLIFGAALVGLSLAGLAFAADAPPSGVHRTELQRSPVPGGKFVALIMRVDIDKGASTGWHTHPGEELGVAVSGQLTVQVKGQPDKVVKSGESFRILAGAVHNGTAGPEGYGGTAIYVVDSDKPLATPAP